MQPCLLLALALLGTASASHPAPASPEAEEAALEVPEEDARCPLESETRALSIPNPLGATTFRYVIVTRCQTFQGAQRVCAQCYRGRLASIHNYHTNACLQRQARLCTNRGQVWIGAITRPAVRDPPCPWEDGTRWNYSHWLRGYPLCTHRYCTSLCTNNGRWRSLGCQVRLPFICKY
ncbi:bone marrow proteoglycan [Gavia stellata]|uniref:bone marrow proteoglycan n=1 Tax=Gavia stellata TaxID=37040 RepID=UPI00289816A6|nr:bone marrow proteoglycan [Gavia stellata]